MPVPSAALGYGSPLASAALSRPRGPLVHATSTANVHSLSIASPHGGIGGYAGNYAGGHSGHLGGGYAGPLAGGIAGPLAGGLTGHLAGGIAGPLAGGYAGALGGGYASPLAGGYAGHHAGGYASPYAGGYAGGYAGQYGASRDYYSHPQYKYAYSVSDPHTGDNKAQHESRDGDVVKGEYSLVQPDGTYRKVSYHADDRNGFNAVVHNSGPNHHVYTAQHHH
ncbi:cuticle protein 19-like [Maniola jurtina]|uniref:cuticle protein 19-like n=1 Tax=Maniola jurtina TaxID=191418 RepID=UPI001E68BBB9|nr:cuticle protein 19-like [Maniola jurtina]